jgi:glutamyl-tRNA synthetase
VLHLGSIRTALFCWLYARHNSGQFVLRIEDTDRQRSTEQNVNAILDGLTWLGLTADEGPYFQTHRFERYSEVMQQWLADGKAYHCYCTKEELDARRAEQLASKGKVGYDGRCRDRTEPRNNVDPVVRFKNPRDGEIIVDDLVRGTVVFENSQLDDLIIARSDRTPTYNFTVVVDDFDMNITHVIRGDDHLNNTPRQINMFRALGVEPPAFAHLPMILGPDGAKLSKRHGAVDIRDYRDLGYLPEAVLNYLVRLGWSFGDQEIFTLDEMIREFDINDVNQSASIFNPEKLLWTNQQHIIAAPLERIGTELVAYLRQAGLDPSDGPDPVHVAEGYRERAETLVQMAASARYCYEDFDEIDSAAARKHLRPVILEPLRAVRENLSNLLVWDKESIAAAVGETAESYGIKMGKLGQPLRVAVTGGAVSPPIDVTIYLVGRERTLKRLDHAVKIIESRKGSGQP